MTEKFDWNHHISLENKAKSGDILLPKREEKDNTIDEKFIDTRLFNGD